MDIRTVRNRQNLLWEGYNNRGGTEHRCVVKMSQEQMNIRPVRNRQILLWEGYDNNNNNNHGWVRFTGPLLGGHFLPVSLCVRGAAR